MVAIRFTDAQCHIEFRLARNLACMQADALKQFLLDPVEGKAIGRPQKPLILAGLFGLQREYPHGQLIVRQLLGQTIDALLPHREMLHDDGRSPPVRDWPGLSQ